MSPFRSICRVIGCLTFLFSTSFAQQTTIPGKLEPADLVRRAVENQIKSVQDDGAHFIFRGTRTTPRGSVTKVYIQTKGATAGMVVAYNRKPLTPEQRAAEEARVERFIKHPEELGKKRR